MRQVVIVSSTVFDDFITDTHVGEPDPIQPSGIISYKGNGDVLDQVVDGSAALHLPGVGLEGVEVPKITDVVVWRLRWLIDQLNGEVAQGVACSYPLGRFMDLVNRRTIAADPDRHVWCMVPDRNQGEPST